MRFAIVLLIGLAAGTFPLTPTIQPTDNLATGTVRQAASMPARASYSAAKAACPTSLSLTAIAASVGRKTATMTSACGYRTGDQSRTTLRIPKRQACGAGDRQLQLQQRGEIGEPGERRKLIANALKSLGFELIGGGAQLTSTRRIRRRGAELRQSASGRRCYYAGHGLGLRGTNYLVPVNANPTREADLDFQMLSCSMSAATSTGRHAHFLCDPFRRQCRSGRYRR